MTWLEFKCRQEKHKASACDGPKLEVRLDAKFIHNKGNLCIVLKDIKTPASERRRTLLQNQKINPRQVLATEVEHL